MGKKKFMHEFYHVNMRGINVCYLVETPPSNWRIAREPQVLPDNPHVYSHLCGMFMNVTRVYGYDTCLFKMTHFMHKCVVCLFNMTHVYLYTPCVTVELADRTGSAYTASTCSYVCIHKYAF